MSETSTDIQPYVTIVRRRDLTGRGLTNTEITIDRSGEIVDLLVKQRFSSSSIYVDRRNPNIPAIQANGLGSAIQANGHVSIAGNLSVANDVTMNGNLNVTNDVTMKGNLNVAKDISLINADIAEEFDIVSDTTKLVEPGTVIVLNNDGSLQPSNQAYDKKVAGILSGAHQYKPAILLDKKTERYQSQNASCPCW
jgi:hypothetical protein